MKYTILDAGFPLAVASTGTDDNLKSIAAYTPGMLIDSLRLEAEMQRADDRDQVAMMLEASAAMLEKVIQKHYGRSEAPSEEEPKGDSKQFIQDSFYKGRM